MKKWEQNILAGTISLVTGIILFLLPFTGHIQSLHLGVSLYLFGMLTAGVGVGILTNTYTIYKLEKRNAHTSSKCS